MRLCTHTCAFSRFAKRAKAARAMLIAIAIATLAGLAPGAMAQPVGVDTRVTARVDAQVAELLACMSPAEKVAQISGVALPDKRAPGDIDEALLRLTLPSGAGTIGPLEMPFGIADDVAVKNRIQAFARQHTRLGIPVLFHGEAAHGLMKPQATSFPVPIALAGSWNEALVEQVFQAVAREMHARGDHLALSPVLDVARDPRWGRVDETLGEDPVLVGRLGAAMVRGLQGSAHGPVPGHVAATLKHLVGHGVPEGGLNRSPASMGPNELRQVHLWPFAHVLRHAAPAAVMPSYNEVDGLPSHANRALLQDMLRGQLGFTGLVVSDYGGIGMLKGQGVAETDLQAARIALDAGVQMDLSKGASFKALVDAPDSDGALRAPLDSDSALRAQVDQAVGAVLRLKFQLGLFDGNPPLQAAPAMQQANSAAHAALALQAARQSIVLLHNPKQTLPLNAQRLRQVAVVGPNADITRLGSYSGTPLALPSLLDAIRQRVGPATTVVHAQGVQLTAQDARNALTNWQQERTALADPATNRRLITEARAAVAGSDVILLVLGDNEATARESWGLQHLGDRASLDLVGEQLELATAMFDTGIPVVVMLMHGRPLALGPLQARAAAMLTVWYAGQATAQAATEILFGDINPSGKLAVSLPRSVGQLPSHYARKPYAGRFGYLFEDTGPLFAFGHGLSYTRFAHGQPRLDRQRTTAAQGAWLDLDVTNTGDRAGDEIVQLYIRDEIALPTRPRLELRDFQRVTLQAGQTRTLRFAITQETLAVLDDRLRLHTPPGWFTLTVGPSSTQGQSMRLEITAD